MLPVAALRQQLMAAQRGGRSIRRSTDRSIDHLCLSCLQGDRPHKEIDVMAFSVAAQRGIYMSCTVSRRKISSSSFSIVRIWVVISSTGSRSTPECGDTAGSDSSHLRRVRLSREPSPRRVTVKLPASDCSHRARQSSFAPPTPAAVRVRVNFPAGMETFSGRMAIEGF